MLKIYILTGCMTKIQKETIVIGSFAIRFNFPVFSCFNFVSVFIALSGHFF